ncbi:RNase H family protein, partial [Francisella tularensis]|nr:ribonuclease HI [Francisella tularensis subsp. holarctica]
LWQELDSLTNKHNVTWGWVKGHSVNAGNEKADELANKAIAELIGK